MNRRSLHRVGFLAVALLFVDHPLVLAAGRNEKERVVVSAREPTVSEKFQRALLGRCYGRRLAVRFIPATAQSQDHLVVKFGASTRSFGSDERFVRELFAEPNAVYQLWLLCDSHEDRHIVLTAFGISPGEAKDRPEYLHAKVTFGRNGALLSYSGLIEDDYEFLQRHLK